MVATRSQTRPLDRRSRRKEPRLISVHLELLGVFDAEPVPLVLESGVEHALGAPVFLRLLPML